MYNLVWESISFSSILAAILSIFCISLLLKYRNMRTSASALAPKQSDIKSTVEAQMDVLEEKIKAKQLEEIYKYMQEHSDQLGPTTRDDMEDLIKLYGYWNFCAIIHVYLILISRYKCSLFICWTYRLKLVVIDGYYWSLWFFFKNSIFTQMVKLIIKLNQSQPHFGSEFIYAWISRPRLVYWLIDISRDLIISFHPTPTCEVTRT